MNYNIIFNGGLNVSIIPQHYKKKFNNLFNFKWIVETLDFYYKIIDNNGAIKLQLVW